MRLERPWRYGLRVGMVLLCLAAWADLRPTTGGVEERAIALVDVSRSIGSEAATLPPDVRVRPDWIVFADGVQEVVGGAESPTIGRGATRLAGALRHVAAARPGADVVLVSDGRGTDGDAAAAARAVRAAGGRVFTRAPLRVAADVGLASARLVAGWPRPRVRVEVESATSGAAEVRLVLGRRVADRRRLRLEPGGRHIVELSDAEPAAAGGTYDVVLVAAPGTPDDDPGDDRLAVGLRPAQRVVHVWGLPEAGALEPGPDLLVRTSRQPHPEALAGADAVVMANVPWRELGRAGARALEGFVAGGGRLLLLGGPDAYAGGGWAGTPLETRLSPLRLPRRDGTELALILALDVSGSTQGPRRAHFVEAARRAVQGLVPGERIGILPFRGTPDAALLPPGVVGYEDEAGRAKLLASIDALEPHGDTDLVAALRAAGERVLSIPARARHVLLITDGDPDTPPSREALGAVGVYLHDRAVRVGAFVLGDKEAVERLRERVATVVPSDIVLADDVTRLPEHLLHALGEHRHEQGLLPAPAWLAWTEPYDPVLAPPGALPALRALHALEVATEAGAVGLVRAHREREPAYDLPLLAVRTVGAGRVAALAWGPALERDRDARRAAVRTLRPWIAGMAGAADRGLQADLEGETLVVQWAAAAGAGRLQATGAGPATDLVEVAPGRFRGPLPAGAEAGVRVRRGAEGGPVRALDLPVRPPPEHRGAGIDDAALQRIAAAGGGRRLAAGDATPGRRPPRGPPWAPWLLLGACILLVLDRLGAKPEVPASD